MSTVKIYKSNEEWSLTTSTYTYNKFDDISMDFITHLPSTTSGNNVILVIVDRLTKYARFIPLAARYTHDLPAAEITAEAVFTHWCRLFDIPVTIVSDRDPQ